MNEPTHMRREIEEIPAAAARLLQRGEPILAEAGKAIRNYAPNLVVSVGRGSSDHAASFLKYAIELTAGIPVASIGPSVASIYGANLRLVGAVCLSISQSGKSPDILSMVAQAKRGGALTVSLTNSPDSPLAKFSDYAIDILAGPERSVAATKSFVCSIVAGLALMAHSTADAVLLDALKRLPDCFKLALDCDWQQFSDLLEDDSSVFILGRGPSNALASEAALKLKETCGIHAEAYSAAEVMHGPLALVGPGFPVLALAARDASECSVAETADALATKGAAVFATTQRLTRANRLPYVAAGHPLTDPLPLIVSFYSLVEALARRRGNDPDKPHNLSKVTETR